MNIIAFFSSSFVRLKESGDGHTGWQVNWNSFSEMFVLLVGMECVSITLFVQQRAGVIRLYV